MKDEESYAVELTEEELKIIEEEIQIPVKSVPDPFETHKVFNEDEEFFEIPEGEEFEPSEELAEMLDQMNDAIGVSNSKTVTKAKPERRQRKTTKGSKTKSESDAINGANRKSTNSYRLVNRTAISFPNPVYTCDGYGKVVINIVVSETGRVVDTKYNKDASTTSNQCLIDNAVNYATKSRFNTMAGKKSQLGTITYVFPGHQ